jgi:hypothetical protein
MWSVHGSRLLAAAAFLMAVMSAMMLTARFTRLISTPGGAVDLRYYFDWSHLWFQGQRVYALPEGPEYPPASMPILWLLVGWLSFDQARLWWALIDAIALAGLAIGFVRASGAEGPARRAFVALMLPSMTPAGAAVGNGQLILHVLPILLIALLVLPRQAPGWRRDIAAALLLAFTLVKPTISAPFFWAALIAYGGVRVVLLTAAVYVGLTMFAAAFQDATLWDLLKTCVMNGAKQAALAPDVNLQFALRQLGLEAWMLPASALALGSLGVWTYRHRRQDVWVLLGVAALVARLWTYHRLYDGVLVTIAEVALFRMASQRFRADGIGVAAGTLLAVTALIFLFPGPAGPGGTFPRVAFALLIGQAVMTVVDLGFLLYAGSRPPCSPLSDAIFERRPAA